MSDDWPFGRTLAHRGSGRAEDGVFPENTFEAVAFAFLLGLPSENDYTLTRDGVVVAMHNLTIEETTNGRGAVRQHTLAELRELDAGGWHSAKYVGLTIPTLEELVTLANDKQGSMIFEGKGPDGEEHLTGHCIASEVSDRWTGNRPKLFSSFQLDVLAGMAEGAPDSLRALNLGKPDEWPEDWFQDARSLGCTTIVAEHDDLPDPLIRDLRRRGMWVAPYCDYDYHVGDDGPDVGRRLHHRPEEVERLFAAGANAVFMDALHPFMR